MKSARWFEWLAVISILGNGMTCGARADTNALPHFQEVFRLLRAHLPDVSEEALNRAAVQGLLHEFFPRVLLATNETAAGTSGDRGLARTTIYDHGYGYLRVARVAPGLGDAIQAACERLQSTNRIKGLILDLRYAGGEDYGAAGGAADPFLNREQPLLEWEGGSARSSGRAAAIRLPLAVLVNRQTSGAAEALAAVLRETDAAVLVGSGTAGRAQVYREFELSNGQRLLVASGPVRLASGRPISGSGVAPDIEVNVGDEDEQAYFADAYRTALRVTAAAGPTNAPSRAGATNRPPRRRVTEADLVRLQREGSEEPPAGPTGAEEPGEPAVRDPALARALDLLKGIAIVERSR